MPTLDIRNFHGLAPKSEHRLKEVIYASQAVDVKVWDGTLRNFPCPVEVCTSPRVIKTILINDQCDCLTSDEITQMHHDCGVTFMASENSEPQMIASDELCTGSPEPWQVPCPDTAPILNPVEDCTDDPETVHVSYCYTLVYQIGGRNFESKPSNPSVNVPLCGDVNITMNAPLVDAVAYRIYRAESGFKSGEERKSEFETQWFRIVETTNATYTDTGDINTITPAPPLLFEYNGPPVTMHHFTTTESGVMVGLSGDRVFYTYPGEPMTWSPKRVRLIRKDWGNALYIESYRDTVYVFTDKHLVTYEVKLTEAGPVLQRMVFEKPTPLVSIQSVTVTHTGVVFASPYGYLAVRGNSLVNLTSAWFNKDEWRQLDPESVVGVIYADALVFATSVEAFMLEYGDDVFTGGNIGSLVSLSLGDTIVGATDMVAIPKGIRYAKGGIVYAWDCMDYPVSNSRENEVVLTPCCPFLYESAIQDVNASATYTAGECHIGVLTADNAITMDVFERDVKGEKVIRSLTIQNNKRNRQFRLPVQRRNEDTNIRLEGCGIVRSVTLATSLKALRSDNRD